MALESGSRLASYEIGDLLGKGGMGEVYRARDTKLGREVAIKVLPAEFSQDEERLARLEREARMLAALNHPNIAAIYGLEPSDDTRFLVLELVEGDTLAERLGRSAIPVEESLKLALQIAEALEAAHEKGVIHRDLKPANIKITPEGRAKVLDFGLAKAFIGDQADANLSNSPTLSMQATRQGVILGTAAYMSPEQAEGETADARADIWSFGVVLFEMLTGRRPFDGKTVARVLAAVLNNEPEWSSLPRNLHPRVRALLDRLLEKDHKDRLSGISDARVEIQKVLADPDGVVAPPVVRAADGPKRLATLWIAVALTALIVGAIAGIGGWMLGPSDRGPVMRFGIAVPEGQAPEPVVPVITISRDGTRVAYAGSNNTQVYLRNIDEDSPLPVQGAGGNVLGAPAFSPDGNWIAFVEGSNGGVFKIPVTGGTPQPVTGGLADNAFRPSWDDRDMILYAQPDGIWQVSANGGPAQLLIPAVDGEELTSPTLLPDGDSILFTSTTASGLSRYDAGQISVYSIGKDDRKAVWAGGSDARYVEGGHLVYAQGTTLMALPFDLDRLEVTGNNPARMVEGLVRGTLDDTANYAVSDNGMLVYLTGGGGQISGLFLSGAGSLTVIDRGGAVQNVSEEVRAYARPRISPDGRRIAVQVQSADGATVHIYVVDVASGIAEQRTFEGTLNADPVWTSDSQSIVFTSDRLDGQGNAIFIQEADGQGAARLVYEHNRAVTPSDLSSEGILVFVDRAGEAGQSDLWTVDITDPESASPFVATAAGEQAGRFSSDGHWIAYTSNESGESRVYVRRYPATGVPQQVFDGPMLAPVWSPDNTELYALQVQTAPQFGVNVVSTAVRVGVEFSVGGRPEPRFNSQVGLSVAGLPSGSTPYDALPDGSGLLWVTNPPDGEGAAAARINVVVHWSEELKERVPLP